MTKRRNNNKQNRFSILFPILSILGIGIIIIIMLTSGYEKSWSHNWNDVSKTIKDSVLLARNTGYTGGTGPNGRSMEKYANTRLWIMNNASEKELLNLIKYPNGTVKAIGYEGLLRSNNYNSKEDLILKSINDENYKVYYSTGCQNTTLEISEYLIQLVLKIDNQLSIFETESIADFGISESGKEKILMEFQNRKK